MRPANTLSEQDTVPHELDEPRHVDWVDVKFALLLGVIMVFVKVTSDAHPDWHFSRTTIDDIASVTVIGYVISRARRRPEKIDEWGLSTPITWQAALMAVPLAAMGIGMLIAGTVLANGTLSFKPAYVSQMIEYIPAGFPQQFLMCSIGLAALSTLRAFRGSWRLPLAVGVVFSLAHFWTPARIPGAIVPVQMILTLPAGFFAAFYFLKFRTIVPLTAIHAVMYPLLHNWIEMRL